MRLTTLLLASAILATPALAAVMVGGAPMLPTRTIVDNAVNSKDHRTLVTAVQAAGLVETLRGPGPFTVFAPTDAAFARLPAGTVDRLLEPGMKPQLSALLTYHVVPGRYAAADLMRLASANGGAATLKTAQGETLTVRTRGRQVMVTDARGGMATVTIADVNQANGVIHVIDTVLMPRS